MNTSLPHIPYLTADEYISMMDAIKPRASHLKQCDAFYELSDICDDMTDENKIALRTELWARGYKKVLRGLSYD
jgi:hypothetical protein